MPRRYRDDDIDLRDFQPVIDGFLTLPRRGKIWLVVVLIVLGIGAAIWYTRQHHLAIAQRTTAAEQSPNLLLGNPSGATSDDAYPDNYLMPKPYFVLSYNNTRGTPNWVSWRLTESDLGNAPRKMEFDPDLDLPGGMTRITHGDYTASGFDRGHLCPHGDRSADVNMSYATFIMTNVIPQAPNVNRKAWEELESYCRDLARRHNHLYIIAGGDGRGGRGSKGPRQDIGQGRVTVPAECWKIAVVVPESGGDDDLGKINSSTRVIAVLMPNDQSTVGYAWAMFRVSPADIEGRTGLRFFTNVRPEIAAALRQQIDAQSIPPPVPRRYEHEESGSAERLRLTNDAQAASVLNY